MNDEKKPYYDYEQYSASLSNILDEASKEYWSQHIDINRHQIMVARTYLWVAAALLGAFFTSYSFIYSNVETSPGPCSILLFVLSVLLSAAAFGLCLYALPGRRGYLKIGPGWRILAHDAYKSLKDECETIHANTLTSLIEEIDRAVDYGSNTNLKRAKLLRFVSWLLIGSFVVACFSCSIYFIKVVTA
ncbi:hypothetical protein SSPSH_000839 [Salinisphaera shabanensis E1L3A]|uniref:Uncharacterized protein n=1 Tax=Salinisphaera shabanensis E1L3A TaxID=1033802 RepID=U2EQB7_9GAMM|nr:hypothetical protein [Salinisphaera shabanensis]ERJ19975.1 hypothetical protein SSPSH_000839 [Salinisphaera shabanensis E1L3A]